MRTPKILPLASFAAVVVLSAPSRADENPVAALTSDAAFRKNVATLISKDVRFDARFGLWFARLSRGPFSSAVAGSDPLGGPPSDDGDADGRVGTGTGTLKDFGISVDVKGNEAFFDYLGNDVFDSATKKATANVKNSYARTLLRQLAGEFRPNLSSLLGPDAYGFISGQYGKFVGPVHDSYLFSSYNGNPYFGGHTATWTTSYTAGNVGVMWRAGDKYGDYFAYGGMLRYESFKRPAALSPDGGTQNSSNGGSGGFFLQDAGVSVTALALRFETQACTADIVCFSANGFGAPATGVAHVDLGRWGSVTGLPIVGQLEGRVGVVLGKQSVSIEPYLGLRAEWLWILGGSKIDDAGEKPTVLTPDYFLWGPTMGVEGHL